MPLTLDGTNGVSAVQAGSIQSDDLAAGVGGVGTEIIPKTTSTNVSEVDINLSGGAYNRVVIEISELQPATDGVAVWVRVIKSGNSSPDTAASDYGYEVAILGTSISDANDSSKMVLTGSNIGNANTTEGWKGTITARGVRDTSSHTSATWHSIRGNINDTPTVETGGGFRRAKQDDDTFRILMSSGNISSITYEVWGYE